MAEQLFNVTEFNKDFERLDKLLEELPGALQEKGMDDAVAAGAEVVLRRVKQPNKYFRDRTGRARESYQIKRPKKRGRRFTDIVGGTDEGATNPRTQPAHVVVLERGDYRKNQIPPRPLFNAAQESALDGSLIRAIVSALNVFRASEVVREARRRSGLSL